MAPDLAAVFLGRSAFAGVIMFGIRTDFVEKAEESYLGPVKC